MGRISPRGKERATSEKVGPRHDFTCAGKFIPRDLRIVFGQPTVMILSAWVQFSWDLMKLPAEAPPLSSRYTVESASAEERVQLLAAVTRSASMEPGWSDDLNGRLKLCEEIVNQAFAAGEVAFLAIKHGSRIIGAAAIRDAGDKLSNLPLGVSVLSEYRCRGLGTFLLYESLRRLRERGLDQARVVTKKGIPADRYLYPKFGSERVVLSGLPV
jgi:GNAT superfamily N-acetyltransferase